MGGNMLQTGTFADRLRLARFNVHMKQPTLAGLVHTTPQTISRWEHGKNIPHITMIQAVAQALGVSSGWLAWGKGEPIVYEPPREL